jgi:hypothetical protein
MKGGCPAPFHLPKLNFQSLSPDLNPTGETIPKQITTLKYSTQTEVFRNVFYFLFFVFYLNYHGVLFSFRAAIRLSSVMAAIVRV